MKAKTCQLQLHPAVTPVAWSKWGKCGTPHPRTRTDHSPRITTKALLQSCNWNSHSLMVSIHQRKAYLITQLREALTLPCTWNTANSFQKLVLRTFFNPKVIQDHEYLVQNPEEKCSNHHYATVRRAERKKKYPIQQSMIQSPLPNHCQREMTLHSQVVQKK